MKGFFSLLALLLLGIATTSAQTPIAELPKKINSHQWKAGHIQGIAVDTKREHIYFSFTTMLIKADMQGNIIGTVTGLLGHLGCIEFNDADGRIYGSLEYKNDSIGKGILKQEKIEKNWESGFYVAIFDVDKIVREGMSAEKDGIMTSVYLSPVVADFNAKVEVDGKVLEHKYGCSGFDGITFGPKFGKSDGKRYLTIAYGIYGDTKRNDNDHQVLLQFDASKWAKYEQPLSQENMHKSGPKKADGKYFVHTGNTHWGVQNMEYDATRNMWILATYRGRKENYANYNIYLVDGNIAPTKSRLEGVEYQKRGKLLTLAQYGPTDPNHSDIRGWIFERPAVGIHALGEDYYYISHRKKKNGFQSTTAVLYKFVGSDKEAFVRVK